MENKADYWQSLWVEGATKWDMGHAAPPLAEFFDMLEDKDMKILIPGAGSGYEAEYLHNKGFRYVYIMDIATKPLENFKERVKDFPEGHLLCEDFFKHKGQYDLIVEHTFFIAIEPKLRGEYVKKMHELLRPGGHLTGLLIFSNEPSLTGPPYLDTQEVYRKHFEGAFEIKKFEMAQNSIKPRAGREVFIDMVK
ncbi:MAG: methyltransferase [Ignavibacteria bacterium]